MACSGQAWRLRGLPVLACLTPREPGIERGNPVEHLVVVLELWNLASNRQSPERRDADAEHFGGLLRTHSERTKILFAVTGVSVESVRIHAAPTGPAGPARCIGLASIASLDAGFNDRIIDPSDESQERPCSARAQVGVAIEGHSRRPAIAASVLQASLPLAERSSEVDPICWTVGGPV